MAKRDYYEVLGVAKGADEATLKSAFRKLAMQFHPDRNPNDAEAERRFKEVNEAYQVLSDPQKRGAYDRFGHQAFEGGGPGGFGNDFTSSMSDIFEDIFGDVFGGGRRGAGGGRHSRERGADLRYNLEISLEEAFAGKSTTLKVPSSIACEACSGTGAKPGSKPKKCQTCNGMGRVRASSGFFAIERTCHSCGGRGEVIEDPCRACSGTGRVTRERTLSVNIPAGVEEGTRIRIAGEGEAGMRGAPSGDLYIFVSVRPHPMFTREGADLFCRVPISMVAAALGTQVDVPVLDGGERKLAIPEGTQSGKQFRLRGRGMPVLRANGRNAQQRGDLYVQALVETPQNLTKRQRDLLEEFQHGSSEKTNPETESYFAQFKKIFGGG